MVKCNLFKNGVRETARSGTCYGDQCCVSRNNKCSGNQKDCFYDRRGGKGSKKSRKSAAKRSKKSRKSATKRSKKSRKTRRHKHRR